MLQTVEPGGAPALGDIDPADLAAEITERLKYHIAKDPSVAQPHDWLTATILVLRDRVIEAWIDSTKRTYAAGGKRVYYLSMEFLIGRLLRDAVTNLRVAEVVREALARLDVDLDLIAELEPDAALGNGGLGRLAACFMESMASVDVPAYGYGIRYQHGLFEQRIEDGWQVERPETWLDHGNPWEFERREAAYEVGFGGSVRPEGTHGDGTPRLEWRPAERVIATAFDTPVVGWRARRVNTLRLWAADAPEPIRLDAFNRGDHVGAQSDRARADALDRVLYPADESAEGQELRLRQEYFLVAASLADIVRRHLQRFDALDTLPEQVAIQLNDTHPAVAVPELMRILIDGHGHAFEDALAIATATFSYTNHTLLPEALETWGVPLFERLLPRHMQLVYAINAHLMAAVSGQTMDVVRAISLIDESGERRVRMGNLAFVGSHAVNGVSGAPHRADEAKTVFAPLHRLFPERIRNKTNGITPRRWLMQCNPGLTDLIREAIGEAFLDDVERLRDLEPFAEDAGFRERFRAVKRANKERLSPHRGRARGRAGRRGRDVRHPDQAHPRVQAPAPQHRGGGGALRPDPLAPRARLAPAREAVRGQGRAVLRARQADREARGRRGAGGQPRPRRARPPQGRVPAQLQRLAGRAHGAGRRPLRAGLDGGLRGVGHGQHEVRAQRRAHHRHARRGQRRDPRAGGRGQHLRLRPARRRGRREEVGGLRPEGFVERSPELSQALRAIGSGTFSPDDPHRYAGLVDDLRRHDPYMLMADFDDYARAQADVAALWGDPAAWDRKAILNTARAGWFSSDRTIREYASDIWKVG